jgi:hypothetical protein
LRIQKGPTLVGPCKGKPKYPTLRERHEGWGTRCGFAREMNEAMLQKDAALDRYLLSWGNYVDAREEEQASGILTQKREAR